MLFRLSVEPLDRELLRIDRSAGALVTFVGRVRDTNEGKSVLSLEYEAFAELAQQEGEAVLSEALKRFPITNAACEHRTGHLQIGEDAIRVEVSSGHRAEAFAACRWIVDEVKARVPIWKKEHYADGASEWIDPTQSVNPVLTEELFYSRQTRLPEVGKEGQARLGSASVLVVGAGGLGSAVLPYLTAAGVGRIAVCDGDELEGSNLHRQILFGTTDLGKPKAQSAAERLRLLNPFVTVDGISERLSGKNGSALVGDHDLVIDCTDSLSTKHLLNRLCVAAGKPLLTSSIYRYEGQVQLVLPGGACLACLWPEPPEEGCVRDCAEVGVLGAVPGVLGAYQATEALKLLLGLDSPLRHGKLLLVDLLSLESTLLELAKNAACPVCGAGSIEIPEEMEIVPPDLTPYRVVDIREAQELVMEPLAYKGADWLPLSEWDDGNLDERPTLLVCHHGVRSLHLTRHLRSQGLGNAFSLPGGTATMRQLMNGKR